MCWPRCSSMSCLATQGKRCIISDCCVIEDGSVLPPDTVTAPFTAYSGSPGNKAESHETAGSMTQFASFPQPPLGESFQSLSSVSNRRCAPMHRRYPRASEMGSQMPIVQATEGGSPEAKTVPGGNNRGARGTSRWLAARGPRLRRRLGVCVRRLRP